MFQDEKQIEFAKAIGKSPAAFDGPADAFVLLSRCRMTLQHTWEELVRDGGTGAPACQLSDAARAQIASLYRRIEEIDFFLGGVAAGITLMEKK